MRVSLMNERSKVAGELMRRVLESEARAHEALEDAEAEAGQLLERARASARSIDARAVERVQRLHERARRADAEQAEALWREARERLEHLEAAAEAETDVESAAARVAGWLSGESPDGEGAA